MVEIPKYEEYDLVELYQVLNSIRGDQYRHVLDALLQELASQEFLNLLLCDALDNSSAQIGRWNNLS